MSDRTWDFNVTRTVTYKVQLTEAEILAYLKDHNLDVPDVFTCLYKQLSST